MLKIKLHGIDSFQGRDRSYVHVCPKYCEDHVLFFYFRFQGMWKRHSSLIYRVTSALKLDNQRTLIENKSLKEYNFSRKIN